MFECLLYTVTWQNVHLQQPLDILGTTSVIFGSDWHIFCTFLEVLGTFLENWVMWRGKFDILHLEKVGRYIYILLLVLPRVL